MENDPRASSIEPDLLAIVAKIEPYDFSQSQFRLIACFTEIKRHFEQTRDGGPFEDLSPKLIFEAGILAARIGFEPIPIEPYNATTDDGLCISGLQFSQPYDRASFVLPLHVTDSSDEQSKRRPGKATCQKIIDLLDRWALAAEGAIPSQLRKGRFTPAKWAIATFNHYQWEVALRAFLPELPPEDDAPPAEAAKPPDKSIQGAQTRSWTQNDLDNAIREYKAQRSGQYNMLLKAVEAGRMNAQKNARRLFGRNAIAKALGCKSKTMVTNSKAWRSIAAELGLENSASQHGKRIGTDIAIEAASESNGDTVAETVINRETIDLIKQNFPGAAAEGLINQLRNGSISDEDAREIIRLAKEQSKDSKTRHA